MIMEAGLDHINLQPASKRLRACDQYNQDTSNIIGLYNSSAAADMNPPPVAHALPLPVPPPPPPPPPTCNNAINACSFDQNLYQQQPQPFPMITSTAPAAPPLTNCSTDSVPSFDYAAILAGLPTEERDFCQPSAIPPGGKTKPCTKFFSTSGCPYGESCHFLHFVPGGIAALGLAVPKPMLALSGTHDPSLTINGYKTRLCNRFNTPEGCRFGDNCHFAHGESDLRRPGKPTYTPPYALNQASTNPPPVQMQASYNQTTIDPSSGYMTSTAVYATGADGSNYAATASAAGCYASCGYAPSPAYNQNPYATNGATNYATSYAVPPVTYQSYPTVVPTFTYTGPAQTLQANTSTYAANNANANVNANVSAINDANGGINNIINNNHVSNSNYGSEPTPPGVTVTAPTVVMPASGYEGAAVLTA